MTMAPTPKRPRYQSGVVTGVWRDWREYAAIVMDHAAKADVRRSTKERTNMTDCTGRITKEFLSACLFASGKNKASISQEVYQPKLLGVEASQEVGIR